MRSTGLAVTLSIVGFLLVACENGTSSSNPPPILSAMPRGNPVTTFQPGAEDSAPQPSNRPEETELVIADGQRLYNHFNCSGCHASGGGAIGPALMDDEWIYGNSADNVFWTIIEGRPQGMPAFGGRISEEQVWSLVAYVRSLSNLEDAPPVAQAESDSVRRGRHVFLQGPCSLCHTIRGTSALASVGPDLTHVASRKTLVGGLPNTRGNLAGWILNPQNIEPETTMPPTPLAPQELHDLLDYLATLK